MGNAVTLVVITDVKKSLREHQEYVRKESLHWPHLQEPLLSMNQNANLAYLSNVNGSKSPNHLCLRPSEY